MSEVHCIRERMLRLWPASYKQHEGQENGKLTPFRVRTQRPTELHIKSPGSVRGRLLGRKSTLSHYGDNYSSYFFNIASNRPSQDQVIDLATGLTFKEEKDDVSPPTGRFYSF